MSQQFNEATQFVDEATGELLVGGFIYIGSNGLDAKLNPITIYPDRELSGTPLANPQTIGADGRSTNKIWVPGKYSFKVESSANVQKYNELENGFDEQVGNTLLINSLGVNDVVVNGSPTVTTLVDSQTYIFTAPADNTGAMTLKIDSTAVVPLKIHHDQALATGDIKQDQKVVAVYNETDNVYEVQTDVSSVTLNGVETLTNKTLTSPVINNPVINAGVSGTAFLDEDNMISDSATKFSSQQSIKAYTDAGDSALNAKIASLNTKIIEIGDWDMNTVPSVNVNHGVTLTKIRSVAALIRNDADSAYSGLNTFNNAETGNHGISCDSTDVQLIRGSSGFYANTNYDDTSYNRGWITIQYTD